jgi:alpha-mannosidase
MTNDFDSTTIYSRAQNNHWHTNYRIDQPGLATFRYILRPGVGRYSPADSARFGLETTRALLIAPSVNKPPVASLVELSSPNAFVETVKVSQDGHALVLRIFGVADHDEAVDPRWGDVKPASIWLSDLTEKPLKPVIGPVEAPAYQIANLRVNLK